MSYTVEMIAACDWCLQEALVQTIDEKLWRFWKIISTEDPNMTSHRNICDKCKSRYEGFSVYIESCKTNTSKIDELLLMEQVKDEPSIDIEYPPLIKEEISDKVDLNSYRPAMEQVKDDSSIDIEYPPLIKEEISDKVDLNSYRPAVPTGVFIEGQMLAGCLNSPMKSNDSTIDKVLSAEKVKKELFIDIEDHLISEGDIWKEEASDRDYPTATGGKGKPGLVLRVIVERQVLPDSMVLQKKENPGTHQNGDRDEAGIHHVVRTPKEMATRPLRSTPLTCARVVRVIRALYAERSRVPDPAFIIERAHSVVIANAIKMYFPQIRGEMVKRRSAPPTKGRMTSILRPFENTRVRLLEPWAFSSFFTLTYHLYLQRGSAALWEPHRRLLLKNQPLGVNALKTLVNRHILGYETSDYADPERIEDQERPFTSTEIDRLRSAAKGIECKMEMRAMLSKPSAFFTRAEPFTEAEKNDMKLFFRFNEQMGFRVPRNVPDTFLPAETKTRRRN